MRPIRFSYKAYRGVPCPVIRIGMKGPLGWIQAEAYVDSGASISIFSVHEAAGLGLDFRKGKETFVTVGDGNSIPVYVHRVPVQIGSIRFKAAVGFSPRLGVGFNLLGRQDIFTRFDITFSEARNLVTFRPITGRPEARQDALALSRAIRTSRGTISHATLRARLKRQRLL